MLAAMQAVLSLYRLGRVHGAAIVPLLCSLAAGCSDGAPQCTPFGADAPPVDSSPAVEIALASTAGGCRSTSSGDVECWGCPTSSYRDSPTPCTPGTARIALPSPAASLALRGQSVAATTCVTMISGEVSCWGLANPALGVETGEPPSPHECLDNAVDVAVSSDLACVVSSAGRVACWGWDPEGVMLGQATETCDSGPHTYPCAETPKDIGLADVVEVEITEMGAAMCARTSDGRISCWGSFFYGEPMVSPTDMGFEDATQMSFSRATLCAVRSDRTLACSGLTTVGQLGLAPAEAPDTCGGEPCARSPITMDTPATVDAVAAGPYTTCAAVGGELWCWGREWLDASSHLDPEPAPERRVEPVPVEVVDVASNVYGSCAVGIDDTVWCWGSGYGAGLEHGTSRREPARVL